MQEVAAEAGAHGHVADLAQMDEVRRLAAELLETYPRIDVLANNAGAMFTSRRVTDDGFEQTFALDANCFHPGVIRTGFGENDG